MLEISRYITPLLHRFDCVIIPEMGGFVANYSPATLDRSKGVIYPPAKGIIFNKNLTKNDGLLTHEIASQMGIGYGHALEILNQFVSDISKTLRTGGRIEITGLGYIYLDAENNIQFLAHQTTNFLKESFGLAPVMAVPVKRVEVDRNSPKIADKVEKDEAELNTLTQEKEAIVIPITETVKKVKSNKRKYYWAAAVLLPILFYSYWIPFQTNVLVTGEFNLSDLNPFKKKSPAVYTNRHELNQVLTDTMKFYPNYEEELAILQEIKQVSESTSVVEPLITNEKHFHIIAGCFVNYDNAINQINELKANGIKAYLFGQADGFHRVAMGSFSTRGEAVLFLNDVRSNGQPNSWLLEE